MSSFVLLLDWVGFERDKYVHTVLEDNLLPNYLKNCKWFGGRNRENWRLKINGAVRMKWDELEFFFVYLQTRYRNNETEDYLFPISFIPEKIEGIPDYAYISNASLDDEEGYLIEAVFDPNFHRGVFNNILNNSEFTQLNKEVLTFENGPGLVNKEYKESKYVEIDSNNTAITYDNKYFFKLYRSLFEGINPEIELLRFFSSKNHFGNYPNYCGSINLNDANNTLYTFGVLNTYIENAKDNWSLTGDYLNSFIDSLIDGNFQIEEQVFVKVAKLAKQTAIMHETLFDQNSHESFRPEPIDRAYRQKIHKDLENELNKSYSVLTEKYLELDEQSQKLSWQFMEARDKILSFMDQILTRPFISLRIRNHGDFHLGQILVNQDGFKIVDYEGSPTIPIEERVIKHSPLRDVASMVRSYHYAVSAKLYNSEQTQKVADKDLIRASGRWYKLMKDTFLDEYLDYFGPNHLLLRTNNEVNYLFQFYLLEKAIHEVSYEIEHRPTWVKITLKGIIDVVGEIEKLRTF